MLTPRCAALLLVIPVLGTACVENKKKPEPADAMAAPAVPSTAPAKARLTVQGCETILVEGEQSLSKERAASDKTCTKDDDCVLVPSGVCAPSCTDYAMTKVASASYSLKRNEIDRAKCHGWRDNDCATITPKPEPTCSALRAACQNKACTAIPATK